MIRMQNEQCIEIGSSFECNNNNNNKNVNFIQHRVSKYDTLAGVAIKYGVEVADVKRINGLVTDHQMFALKTIKIPQSGRHPPSAHLFNGSASPGEDSFSQVPPWRVQSDLFNSFHSLGLKPKSDKVSPAIRSLLDYNGLGSSYQNVQFEASGNGVCKEASNFLDGGPFLNPIPPSNTPLSLHRKSRSLANCFANVNTELDDLIPLEAGESETDKWNEKLVRRRQKSVADLCSYASETILKVDNNENSGSSSVKGKGLALRNKATSRATLTTDPQYNISSSITSCQGETSPSDIFVGVRKSSSTSSLQDRESSGSVSFWPTSKWNLKPDMQALSNAVPIFDGLPNPLTSRRNKTAVD